MIKRSVIVIGIFLSVILISSFVSASWFDDLFEKITGKVVASECEEAGYVCGPMRGGAKTSCASLGENYEPVEDSSLHSTCVGYGSGCCKEKGVEEKDEEIEEEIEEPESEMTLCEEQGYVCGQIDGAGSMVSCLKKGLEYVGDEELDLSCDSSGMAGCCKEEKDAGKEINLCNQLSENIKDKIKQEQDKKRSVIFNEGEDITKDDKFIVYSPNNQDKARVFRIRITTSLYGDYFYEDRIEFIDRITMQEYYIKITEKGKGTIVFDDFEYFVSYGVDNNYERYIRITWGDGATYGDVGDEKTIFDCEGFIDTAPPKIEEVYLFDIEQTTAKIKVRLNKPALCRYSLTNKGYNQMLRSTETLEAQKEHTFLLEELDPLKEYTYFVWCKDASEIFARQSSSVTIYSLGWKCKDSFNKVYQERNGTKKDLTYCENGCVDGGCIDESLCKELIDGQNNIEENRINLIFVGFNFKNIEDVKDISNTYVNQLTSYEPFNSNQDKFNYWYINQLSVIDNPSVGLEARGFEMTLIRDELSTYCLVQNKQLVAIGNWDFRANANFNKGMRMSAIDWWEYKDRVGHSGYWEYTFTHEFGHSFGLLHDEYLSRGTDSSSSPDWLNCDVYDSNTGIACLKWCNATKTIEEIGKLSCSGTDRSSCQNPYCRWIYDCPSHPWCSKSEEDTIEQVGCINRIELCKQYKTEETCNLVNDGYWRGNLCKWNDVPNTWWGELKCIPSGFLKGVNIGVDCIEDTGCYTGCTYNNWYKPYYYDSMMGGYAGANEWEFKYLHRKQICNQLKERTGSAGGSCTTEFGII